jgi:hypothetical protein
MPLISHFYSRFTIGGAKAEVDFLSEFSDRSFPLEVKAGIYPKSKSLNSCLESQIPVILV